MTKKNTSRAAARARAAQQAGSTTPYTALLRAGAPAVSGEPSVRTLGVQLLVTTPSTRTEDRRTWAQVVVDSWAQLTSAAGGRYPAAGSILPLASSASRPGLVGVTALVDVLRDWSSPTALPDTLEDLRRAALAAVTARWPAPGNSAVISELEADVLDVYRDTVAAAGVRTRDIDPRLAALLQPLAGSAPEEGSPIAISGPSTEGVHGRPAVAGADDLADRTDWSDVQEEPAGGWPYRLVDAEWRGWLTARNGLYRADYGFEREGLEELWPYARIVAERGPVRPVNHDIAGDNSAERLAALWEQAGRKALASTLVALHRVKQRLPRPEFGGPHPLTAGRAGSWESQVLLSLGRGIGKELSEKPKRYDETVAEGIADVLEGWVRHPEAYTEVADNLASQFSDHADRAGGWQVVADQWFQPGARAGHRPDTVFRVATLLMKNSSDFDPDLYR
ncbi:hypothetical protein [Kitasatospora indigofera]|uniref:hypothetical protein n=1 Tax=Kitasatospora indigofera TaxID=67307 RepID=UPI0036BEEE6B